MSLRGSKATTVAPNFWPEPGFSTDVSFCPATTCAAGDDERRLGDPAAARDAQPARGAEDAHDARRGLPDARCFQQRRIGRLDR